MTENIVEVPESTYNEYVNKLKKSYSFGLAALSIAVLSLAFLIILYSLAYTIGFYGEPGAKGAKGPKGDDGKQGEPGEAGNPGPPGQNGSSFPPFSQYDYGITQDITGTWLNDREIQWTITFTQPFTYIPENLPGFLLQTIQPSNLNNAPPPPSVYSASQSHYIIENGMITGMVVSLVKISVVDGTWSGAPYIQYFVYQNLNATLPAPPTQATKESKQQEKRGRPRKEESLLSKSFQQLYKLVKNIEGSFS